MKQQSEQADRYLDDCIPYKRTAQSFAVAPDEERADRHSTEEDGEDEDLGVGTVADEEREVARPDRFIHEPRRARQEKQRIEREQHWRGLKRLVALDGEGRSPRQPGS